MITKQCRLTAKPLTTESDLLRSTVVGRVSRKPIWAQDGLTYANSHTSSSSVCGLLLLLLWCLFLKIIFRGRQNKIMDLIVQSHRFKGKVAFDKQVFIILL